MYFHRLNVFVRKEIKIYLTKRLNPMAEEPKNIREPSRWLIKNKRTIFWFSGTSMEYFLVFIEL